MIDCEHRWPMVFTNRGLSVFMCALHQKAVNDTICSACEDRCGECDKGLIRETGYPKRSEEEVKQIKKVCDACPLFQIHDQRCSKTPYELLPTDVLAQHPDNHCPEKLW